MEHLCVRYGEQVVLADFSLSLPETGTVALMGPTGCGKTTLLRVLSGLLEPQSGRVCGLAGKRVAVLFQEDRLLPWLSARDNVAAVLEKGETACAEQALRDVGLPENAFGKRPAELSGGMRRRVALARLLAYGGDVWLLDEPFKGLDADSRARVMQTVKRAGQGKLMVLVTHEKAEAQALSERIVTLAGPPLRRTDEIGGPT